jgi:sugar O-acyltransferase (sialic acid O-acetyltransferase NeuD family)
MIDLILIGAGGHCLSVIDAVEQEGKYNILGVLDNQKKEGDTILDYKILGNDNLIPTYKEKACFFVITIGQIKSSSIRIKIDSLLNGGALATIISPKAYVSKHAIIGAGTVVLNGANVNAAATIGKHCIINTQANIEHGVTIEDFCHISTGAMVNGDCIIKQGSFIGSNATIIQGKTIEANSVISAGMFIK